MVVVVVLLLLPLDHILETCSAAGAAAVSDGGCSAGVGRRLAAGEQRQRTGHLRLSGYPPY